MRLREGGIAMQITVSKERLEEIHAERRKRLLNMPEVITMLGCSERTLRRHISLFGFPKGVDLPGGKFWDLDDIQKYVKSKKKK